MDRAHLDIITRYVTTILTEENLSYITPSIKPAEEDRQYVLTLTAKLLGESSKVTELTKVPADWFSHLLLTLSTLKVFGGLSRFVKYTDIVVKTETTTIDPVFSQAFGNTIVEDSKVREVEE